jgi:hypothetical protein
LAVPSLETGDLHNVGQIQLPTEGLEDGLYQVRLVGMGFANGYELAVLSQAAAAPLDMVRALDAQTLARIEAADTVVYAVSPDSMKPNAELGHTVLFWNTVWTGNQPPHTLGLINDVEHPVFQTFPALPHSSWHEWELTHGRRALDLSGLPARHLIHVIDDWNRNRDLALVAEIGVGQGRLIVCAVDLDTGPDHRLVGGKLRQALSDYAHSLSKATAPQVQASDVLAWWERVRA